MRQLAKFQPRDEAEACCKAELTALWAAEGSAILGRERLEGHVTAAGFIVNPTLDRGLLVHHNIYQSYCWTGGHADGEADLLAVALREAMEETGIKEVYPATSEILSLDFLPVPSHQKQGQAVAAHVHYSVAYGLIAPENQTLQSNAAENSDVAWFALDQLADVCQEPHMLPVYRKILQRLAAIQVEKKEAMAALPRLLLPWYDRAARQLPWRQNREPYSVWLSEIMLQQTRVEAVKLAYQQFLAALPTIGDLAEVSEDQLMKLWEGLGYYNRASNLQRAANFIVHELGGQFPQSYEGLLALPGIGSYTAGAIASICFEQPQPAVDGNVLRVVSRLTEDFCPLDKPRLKQGVTAALAAVYPPTRRGDFTQSLMELGATVCLPNGAPHCGECPLVSLCRGYRQEAVDCLPVKGVKKPRRVEARTVLMLCYRDNLALRKRGAKGLLAGLWEFPNVGGTKTPQEAMDLATRWGVEPRVIEKSVERVHLFTHVEWDLTCYYLRCNRQSDHFVWSDRQRLEKEKALPTAFRMFLTAE